MKYEFSAHSPNCIDIAKALNVPASMITEVTAYPDGSIEVETTGALTIQQKAELETFLQRKERSIPTEVTAMPI